MDFTEANTLSDRLDDLKTVERTDVYYVDGGRIYESYCDYTPEGHDDFEVEIVGSTEGVIQPDVIALLAEAEVGITNSLLYPGTIRTRSTGLTTAIMDL